MSKQEIDRLSKRLDACFKRVKDANIDVEVQSDLACYLCVLVSGYLESAIYEIVIYYAENKSAPQVTKYVEMSLSKWTNPNVEKILTLFGMFNSEWRLSLESYFIDQRKEHINSLVGLRHAIAHGDSASITFSRIESYYETVKAVVKKLEDLVS